MGAAGVYQEISDAAISAIMMMMSMGFMIPLAVTVIWKLRSKDKISTVLIGAAMFISFAIVLESIPKAFIFNTNYAVGRALVGHPWAQIIIAALLAGIFEETGRFVAFKLIIPNRRNPETAISYGIGHGGFEVMYLLGVGGLNNWLYALLINTGGFASVVEETAAVSPEQAASLEELPAALASVTMGLTALAVLERMSAMMIHIACSILVFASIRVPDRKWLFPVAIVMHASIDVIAGCYQFGVIPSEVVTEIILFVWGLAFLLYASRKVLPEIPRNAVV